MVSSEWYPGSTRKRKQYSEPEPVKPPIGDLPELGKPHYYLVNNVPTALYKIGSVARALNRASVTIRKWEQEGVIPVSPYKMPSRDERGHRRLYSREQIESLRQIAYDEGVLHPSEGGKWKHIANTNFKERAAKAFSM